MSAPWMKALVRASAIALCLSAAAAYAAPDKKTDADKEESAGKTRATPVVHDSTPRQTPPGHGGTPPGHDATPPGHTGTPPGQSQTDPGHGGTPPGHSATPPGHGGTPPGHGGVPPGHAHDATPVTSDPQPEYDDHDEHGHRATPVYGPGPTAVVVEDRSWLESHGQIPHFDLGVTTGYNNPGGMLGVETEYRSMEFLGVGVHGGIGLWGTRISPVVHAYPFGASNLGLYAEGGFSLNLGGPTSVTLGGVTRKVTMSWDPAVDIAVGLRRQWLTFFWTNVKLGYQWKLGRAANDYTVTDGLGALPAEFDASMALSRPGAGPFGGFVFGMSCGIAFL